MTESTTDPFHREKRLSPVKSVNCVMINMHLIE